MHVPAFHMHVGMHVGMFLRQFKITYSGVFKALLKAFCRRLYSQRSWHWQSTQKGTSVTVSVFCSDNLITAQLVTTDMQIFTLFLVIILSIHLITQN
jgi:hypothetical protein